MNGITVPMAIVDFLPVLLFFIGALILLKDLYNKMVKGAYALLATGSIMVFIGGLFKATWKILYALNICDFQALDASFFPLSGTGFLLTAISFLGLLSHRNTLNGVVVTPYVSNMPFVICQILGSTGVLAALSAIAGKLKQKKAIIMFIISFIFMLGMGYLSAKFDDSSKMHWLAQLTNIISWGSMLIGVIMLHRAGLGEKDSLR